MIIGKQRLNTVESLTMVGVNLTVATGERFVRRLQHRNTERLQHRNTECLYCNAEIQNVCIATQNTERLSNTEIQQYRVNLSVATGERQQFPRFTTSSLSLYWFTSIFTLQHCQPDSSNWWKICQTFILQHRNTERLYCNTEIQQYRVNLTIATVLIFGRKINKVFCLCCLVAKLNYLNFRICFINFLGKNIKLMD